MRDVANLQTPSKLRSGTTFKGLSKGSKKSPSPGSTKKKLFKTQGGEGEEDSDDCDYIVDNIMYIYEYILVVKLVNSVIQERFDLSNYDGISHNMCNDLEHVHNVLVY